MVTTERSLEEVLLFVDKKKHTLLFIHKAIINGYLILTSGCYHILFLFFLKGTRVTLTPLDLNSLSYTKT